MGHGHDHHGHDARARPGPARATRAPWRGCSALTAGFAVAEVVGGLVAGSLALLADAAHMVSDVASLALALGAIWLARRPGVVADELRLPAGRDPGRARQRRRRWWRWPIWIIVEAVGRLSSPTEVDGGVTLVIGLAGLAVNVVGATILWRSQAARA